MSTSVVVCSLHRVPGRGSDGVAKLDSLVYYCCGSYRNDEPQLGRLA